MGRSGSRLEKALDEGVPGWGDLQSPQQYLEQQTEEVGEGVSEIVLVLKGGHQRSCTTLLAITIYSDQKTTGNPAGRPDSQPGKMRQCEINSATLQN